MAVQPKPQPKDAHPETDEKDTEKGKDAPADPVDEASEESFPASDAPSWTPTHLSAPEKGLAEG